MPQRRGCPPFCRCRDHSASATYFCLAEAGSEEWIPYQRVPQGQKEFYFRNKQVPGWGAKGGRPRRHEIPPASRAGSRIPGVFVSCPSQTRTAVVPGLSFLHASCKRSVHPVYLCFMGSLCLAPADPGRSRVGLCHIPPPRMLNVTRSPGRDGLCARPSAAGWRGSGPAAGFCSRSDFCLSGITRDSCLLGSEKVSR